MKSKMKTEKEIRDAIKLNNSKFDTYLLEYKEHEKILNLFKMEQSLKAMNDCMAVITVLKWVLNERYL